MGYLKLDRLRRLFADEPDHEVQERQEHAHDAAENKKEYYVAMLRLATEAGDEDAVALYSRKLRETRMLEEELDLLRASWQ